MYPIPASCRAYYSVLIPWVPTEFATEWHNPDIKGSWGYVTIIRGAFTTIGEAITWGKANLCGAPYSVKLNAEPLAVVEVNPPTHGPDDGHSGVYIVIRTHRSDNTRDLMKLPSSVELTEGLANAMVEHDLWEVNLPLSRLAPVSNREVTPHP